MNQLQKTAALDTLKQLILIMVAAAVGIGAVALIPIPVLMVAAGSAGLIYAVYMLYRIRLSDLEYKQKLKEMTK